MIPYLFCWLIQLEERLLRIYVGNLPYHFTEEDLRSPFEGHGEVESITIIRDRDTGRSKGFGFVEMPSGEEAQAAMAELNGKEFDERPLVVNEARPREERDFGGRGGGGGFRGGGGGGGRGGRRY